MTLFKTDFKDEAVWEYICLELGVDLDCIEVDFSVYNPEGYKGE